MISNNGDRPHVGTPGKPVGVGSKCRVVASRFAGLLTPAFIPSAVRTFVLTVQDHNDIP